MSQPNAEKDALRAIVRAFDYYMRPGMEIGDGPEPWQDVLAAIESARPLVQEPTADYDARERGTIRRGDGKRYDAIRDPKSGKVWATRGHGQQESYFGTTARLSATFEPERLTLSGSTRVTPPEKGE